MPSEETTTMDPERDPQAPPTAEGRPGPAPGDASAGRTEAAPPDPVELLKAEVARLKDEHLRLIAETRNQQQRASRDRQDALKYAEWEFARDLLLVLDDLERTQEAAKSASNAQTVAEGVRITCEHFLKLLRDRKIEPLSALGQPFDPTYHEALMKQPSDQHAEGVVMQEVSRGWRMHERVLRPARVILSSGPAKKG